MDLGLENTTTIKYLTKSNMDILSFIDELRSTDRYIRHIYTKGGCYKFHLLLSKMYKGCVPYISHSKDHIITRYRGKFYDINGAVKCISPKVNCIDGYVPLGKSDIPMVEDWSFHKNNLIVLKECPHCDEPLIY